MPLPRNWKSKTYVTDSMLKSFSPELRKGLKGAGAYADQKPREKEKFMIGMLVSNAEGSMHDPTWNDYRKPAVRKRFLLEAKRYTERHGSSEAPVKRKREITKRHAKSHTKKRPKTRKHSGRLDAKISRIAQGK